MNRRYFYTLAGLLLGVVLWLANSSGAGNVQGEDRTGSPLGLSSCNACHGGGNFGPNVTAQLLDSGNPVSQYEANKEYTLRVRITTTSTPSRYGFMAVALTGNNNAGAGTFGMPPAGFRRTTISGRVYVEHSSPRTSNTMDFPWTSPATLGEPVRFFAAGIASNNNGNTNGDAPAQLAAPLVIAPMVSSTVDNLAETWKLRAWPTPDGDAWQVHFTQPQASQLRLVLYDLNGRQVWADSRRTNAGENQMLIPAAQLPRGIYVLSVRGGASMATIKITK